MSAPDRRRFLQGRELFEECVGLEPSARRRLLDERCCDPTLRREVEVMLEQHGRAEDRVEQVVGAAASDAVEAWPGPVGPGSGDRLEPGQRVAHYEVESRIGRGGMGEIYAAQDLRLDRRLALKVLPAEWSEDAERLARLRREAHSLAALNHPNIVTLYAVEECDGAPMLALELVEGTTLRDRLREGPLSVTEFGSIARQLAAGMAAAHSRGLLHRDLKPDNVMLTSDGLVKILDFGLARSAQREAEGEGRHPSVQTSTGMILGTAPYMAPEQIEGKATDPRSDVFSLGCVLYEMSTGVRPFDGDSVSAVIASVLRDQPAEPVRLRPDIPLDLAAIIVRCLEKDPARRFHDAGEVEAALEDCDQYPRGGSAGPIRVRGGHTARRLRPWLLIAGLVALVVSLAALVLLRPGSATAPAAFSPSESSIAVVPLRSADDGTEDRILAEGLGQSLSEALAAAGAAVNSASDSMRRFEGSAEDVRSFAERLNVASVLTGSVARADGVVRLNLDLIDVGTGDRLWTRSVERGQDQLPRLVDEVAKDVAMQLDPRLASARTGPAPRTRAPDGAAYLEYIRGRHYWNQRTNEGYELAIQAFRRALDLDPTFARAYVGLADATAFLPVDRVPASELYDRGITIVQRALDIDPTLAEAHATMAMLVHNRDLDFERAMAGYRRAIELSPRYGTAHHWLGELLGQLGRFDESEHHLRRALEVDPLSSAISADLGQLLFHARRFDDALEHLEETAHANPEFARTYRYLGELHDELGQHERAIGDFERSWALDRFGPVEARARADRLRRALLDRGADGYFRERLALDREDDPDAQGWEVRRAKLHAAIGDREQALDWLERALDTDDYELLFLVVHPRWDALRNEPRFEAIRRELGLPDMD